MKISIAIADAEVTASGTKDKEMEKMTKEYIKYTKAMGETDPGSAEDLVEALEKRIAADEKHVKWLVKFINRWEKHDF